MPTTRQDFCESLLHNWEDLADDFLIPKRDRGAFTKGREVQGILDWLEARGRKAEIIEAVERIGRKELQASARELAQEFTSIVVLAMTSREAIELQRNLTGSPSPELLEVKILLQDHGLLQDFTKAYGEHREDWKPSMEASKPSIKELIHETANSLGNSSSIEYLSEDFLCADKCENTCEKLRSTCGLVIVDMLSMFNRKIQDAYNYSQFMNPASGIAFLSIPLLQAQSYPIRDFLENNIASRIMGIAFNSSMKGFNPHFEFRMMDLHGIRRWLFSYMAYFKKHPFKSIGTKKSPMLGKIFG